MDDFIKPLFFMLATLVFMTLLTIMGISAGYAAIIGVLVFLCCIVSSDDIPPR